MTRALMVRGRSALYRFRPTAAIMGRVRPRALVLVYHRVAEPAVDPFRLAVSPRTFDRHLGLLRQHFTVASAQAIADRGYQDRSVVVTFDDGYEDNARVAYPIAARHAVPLTIFVTAQPVLSGGWFWWDELGARVGEPGQRAALHVELKPLPACDRRARLDMLPEPCPETLAALGRPLTPTELREFAERPGVTIGAHTMTHPSLARAPADLQASELTASKRALEALLARPVTIAAYPFGQPGDVSMETRRLARSAGYRAVFTTTRGVVTPHQPSEALPRLTVYDWSDQEFMNRINRLFRAA